MTTSTAPSTFTFAPGLNLRSITRDGEPWFVALDACRALAYTNPTVALQKVDADDLAKMNLGGKGGYAANVINESGLYTLILGSKMAGAKAFKKWVTGIVLPAIRKRSVSMTLRHLAS